VTDEDLIAAVDAAMEEARRRAGARWTCGVGSAACCFGAFPINRLDARRLQRGLRELSARDPARAAQIRARAREAVLSFRDFPGDAKRGLLDADEAGEEAFCQRHAASPCPALDPLTLRCDLYAHRPVSCRTLGPPVRVGETDLAPCPHCYRACGLADDAVRVVVDPKGFEDHLLEDLEAREGGRGETLVAFALLGKP
jgi:Fe-S-cluster containining protein